MRHLAFVPFIFLVVTGCATGSDPGSAAGANALNVADAAISDGNPSMALSVSKSVLQENPRNVQALIHEGNAYYALQRCADAIAAFQLALKLDPASSAAETGTGRCLLKTDAIGAEAALFRAVQDDPSNDAAWDDLGVARDLEGKFAAAIPAFQQALLTDPGSIPAEVNLGLSLALAGNSKAALQYLGPLAAGPNATARIRENYAAALVSSGRDKEAQQVLSLDLPAAQIDQAMAALQVVFEQRLPMATDENGSTAERPVALSAPVAVVGAQSLDANFGQPKLAAR
jgi:Flp pilus assembly protein TadD